MTRNQLTYHANVEAARHNRAVETETNRANLATEAETFRSNWAKEQETNRSNRANEQNKRHELVIRRDEVDNTDAHYRRQDDETYRANRVKERETERHNYATEEGVKYTADRRLDGQYVKTIGNMASLFMNAVPTSGTGKIGF